jgi:hypothetical protein
MEVVDVRRFMELVRRAADSFEEQLVEQGYEGTDEIDAEECEDDFRIVLHSLIDDALYPTAPGEI